MLRGGGPRYHYNSSAVKSLKGDLHYNLNINDSLPAYYDQTIFAVKQITKQRLRIVTGIEMFYGNFDEFKFIYAAREFSELSEYMNNISKLKSMKNKMTSVMTASGMAGINKLLAETKSLDSKISKLRKALLEKLHELEKYNITEDDLENLYQN